jgi:predicted ATPase
LEWIQKVEKVFEWYEYSEERKCKVAALEFTDYALLWWENLKIQRRRDGEEEITTRATMKRVMKKRFVPDYYIHQTSDFATRIFERGRVCERV